MIPALNEEETVAEAIGIARRVAARHGVTSEILVIDDGSTDQTGRIAEEKADLVIRHRRSMGMGKSYLEGVEKARGEHVVLFPGDNEISEEALFNLIGGIGKADLINAYPSNPEVRPLGRQILSKLFVWIVRLLSGYRLRYFNGPTLCRRDLTQSNPIRASGFGFNAELVTLLLQKGCSVHEVPMRLKPQPGRKSKALRILNLLSILRSLVNIAASRLRRHPSRISVESSSL